MVAAQSLLLSLMVYLLVENAVSFTFTSRLIHRFSEEAKALRISRSENWSSVERSWPERRSMEYYQILLSSDFQRQKMKLGSQYQLLFPSEGSKTMSFGNDFGWCSLVFGASIMQDRDLNEYSPTSSSTSKHIPCSHHVCDSKPSCKNSKQPCAYQIDYNTENTSSSGLLVEDILHLSSGGHKDASNSSVQASVVIGCGMKQSGGYLDGVAPDGLMGLGLGEISVPSFLAKAGLVQDSFSVCFDDNYSGRIFFGDQGAVTQQSTPFLLLDGKYQTYIIGVEAICIEKSCLKQNNFKALVDSGTSFTFLPQKVYEDIAIEFDRRVNATRSSFEGYPWKYCYKLSLEAMPEVPSMTLMFPLNNSFVVHDPFFVVYGTQGAIGFCLAIQPTDGDSGIIGQNFMTGYRMVFDREKLKLGWSRSSCRDLSDREGMNPTPPKGTSNPLPANEQQSIPGRHSTAPAIAGRAVPKPSAASSHFTSFRLCIIRLLLLPLLLFHLVLAKL